MTPRLIKDEFWHWLQKNKSEEHFLRLYYLAAKARYPTCKMELISNTIQDEKEITIYNVKYRDYNVIAEHVERNNRHTFYYNFEKADVYGDTIKRRLIVKENDIIYNPEVIEKCAAHLNSFFYSSFYERYPFRDDLKRVTGQRLFFNLLYRHFYLDGIDFFLTDRWDSNISVTIVINGVSLYLRTNYEWCIPNDASEEQIEIWHDEDNDEDMPRCISFSFYKDEKHEEYIYGLSEIEYEDQEYVTNGAATRAAYWVMNYFHQKLN